MSITNRRRYERATAEIACKCRRSAKTLFAPAQTLDLSPGGASLQITSPRQTEIGDRLALAFNSPDCPIMSAAKMIGAHHQRFKNPPLGAASVALGAFVGVVWIVLTP